jgi:hypothetical protein
MDIVAILLQLLLAADPSGTVETSSIGDPFAIHLSGPYFKVSSPAAVEYENGPVSATSYIDILGREAGKIPVEQEDAPPVVLIVWGGADMHPWCQGIQQPTGTIGSLVETSFFNTDDPSRTWVSPCGQSPYPHSERHRYPDGVSACRSLRTSPSVCVNGGVLAIPSAYVAMVEGWGRERLRENGVDLSNLFRDSRQTLEFENSALINPSWFRKAPPYFDQYATRPLQKGEAFTRETLTGLRETVVPYTADDGTIILLVATDNPDELSSKVILVIDPDNKPLYCQGVQQPTIGAIAYVKYVNQERPYDIKYVRCPHFRTHSGSNVQACADSLDYCIDLITLD